VKTAGGKTGKKHAPSYINLIGGLVEREEGEKGERWGRARISPAGVANAVAPGTKGRF